MNRTDLIHIRAWFHSYAGFFLGADGERDRIFNIKIDHSERVAREAACLARDLSWAESAALLAEVAGWLHDAGRFSQYADYSTFSDAISVNHGERGRQVVEEARALSRLSADEQERVLQSIRHHNARALPEKLDDETLRLARLVRDADKLDIFEVVHKELETDGFRDLPQLQPDFKLDGPLSQLVMDELEETRSCSFKHVKSLADFMVVQLSWLYDLNYSPSFSRVKERGIVKRIASRLPKGGRVEGIVRAADSFVNEGSVSASRS